MGIVLTPLSTFTRNLLTEKSTQVKMRSFFSAKSSAKRQPAANRQPQYEEYDNGDDSDEQYESTDDSISSYEGSDSGSDSRFSSRDPSRQESRQSGPAGMNFSRQQMLGPAPAERRSYGSMGGQAPPQFTRGPAANALQQTVPEWCMREPAQRYHNPDVVPPGFDNSQIRNPFPAEPVHPNHGSVPERTVSIPRKPVPGPGKRILIAVFGMTGTGKTSFIKTLAGEAASQLRIGHDLESCMYFDLQSLYCS